MNKSKQTVIRKAFITFLTLLMITGCGQDNAKQKTQQKSYIVKPEKLNKVLHFSGTIQPLREQTITNAIDGVVDKMPFSFGQKIEKGKTIFVLKSSELQKQYNDTLTEYLKAKDAFNVARSKFSGTKDLWDAGLISKNNYLSEKSSLNNSRVSMEQAARKLTELINKVGDEDNYQHLCSLNLADFKKVQLAFSKKHDQIWMRAPAGGVLIQPPKQSSDDKNGRISVGSTVKSGQLLALIGDMNGIRVEIEVPEVDIDKVKPGMKAKVRSVAYPQDVMEGELISVNAQATGGAGNSLPTFPAVIEVKNLSAQQKDWVKVGMSTTIELSAEQVDKLMVPIQAVRYKQGQSVVLVQDESGVTKEVTVNTGAAQVNKVVIESGLKSGDVVLYG